MNTFVRLTVVTGLLLAVGTTALLLQSWVNVSVSSLKRGAPGAPDETMAPWHELAYRERIALASLAVAAIAAVTVAAALPGTRPRAGPDRSARENVELLARTAATQSEALALERNVRQRTEENLALEQMRAGQAVADKARLGRDLHDGIIQTLYAAGLVLASAREKIPTQPQRAAGLLDQGVSTLNAAIRDVRLCIDGLAEAHRQGGSLPAAIGAVTEMLGSGREAVFDTQLDPVAVARVDETQYADLIQIIREAVSNALRHGAAKTVTLRLQEDADRLALLVQDDGRGFDPAPLPGIGHGLTNLRTRAALLHGELRLTSAPGTGTRLVLTFPASKPAPLA
ncbi:MAG: sensor histidine kinase [Verrucomicrobiota bacterium]